MTSSATSVTSTALIAYEEQPWTQAKKRRIAEIDAVATRSFEAQWTDSRLLPSPLSRACILAGDYPRPLMGPGLPAPYQGTREDFIRTVSETVHTTVNQLDYNGLPPFLKTLAQLQKGSNFLEASLDARDEEPGTTCVGMSRAVLKQLQQAHGIEGCFAAHREVGQYAFGHAAVVVECSDGVVLIEPNSNPDERIFSIPFHETVTAGALSLTAAGPGSSIPVAVTYAFPDEKAKTCEYCTNLANGDELVTKHFMMEAPFQGNNPAFPVSAYYPNGKGSKMVWISPLRSKLTLKDATLPPNDSSRTAEITFDEIRQGELRPRLKRLYENGRYPFHMPLDTLEQQLITFVQGADVVDKVFRDVRFRPAPVE